MPAEAAFLHDIPLFASMDDDTSMWKMYRIQGGNDRLATALAKPLGPRLQLRTELVAVSQRGTNVRVSIVASVLPRRRMVSLPTLTRIRTCPSCSSGTFSGTSMQNASRAVVCSACTNAPPPERE